MSPPPRPLLAALPAPSRVREAVEAALRDGATQVALPGGDPAPGALHVPDLLASLLRALSWLAVAVAVALLAGWLLRALAGLHRDVAAPSAPGAEAPRVGRAPLEAAEALAAQGRFGEAIHVLLLRTLEALAARRGALARSATSREILRAAALGGEARSALEGLVVAVEVSHFGGAVPGEEDWRSCLGAFHRFLAAEGAA
jgi:hypothetical protein